ncbi:hypothetical protein RN001_002727 [Aquatica leii]|uniref:Uncharacterized protein n=1 Tax=Aquatica leii TaxID=1421715 RepID=A0AAN7SDH2_9COLE|nr:hypothetical protein RN001_002727 [Aquatica leii]
MPITRAGGSVEEARGALDQRVGGDDGVAGVSGGTTAGVNVSVEDLISLVVTAMKETRVLDTKRISNAEIAALLPEFSGSSDEDATIWFQRMDTIRAAHELTDAVMVVVLATKLRGTALAWFHSKPSYAAMTYEHKTLKGVKFGLLRFTTYTEKKSSYLLELLNNSSKHLT